MFASITFGYSKAILQRTYNEPPSKREHLLEGDNIFLTIFREIEELVAEKLPKPEEDNLKDYLCYCISEILELYANDVSEFLSYRTKNYLTSQPDEQIYKQVFAKMSLLKYSSLVFPQAFTTEEIENFIKIYSLK